MLKWRRFVPDWVRTRQLNTTVASSIITSVPFLFFYYLFASPRLASGFFFFSHVRPLIDGLFSIVLIYVFAKFNSSAGLVYFQALCRSENVYHAYLATSLLYSSKNELFDDRTKDKFRARIYRFFGEKTPDRKSEEKNRKNALEDLTEAVLIVEAMCCDDDILRETRIKMDYFRSLAGGSLFAAPASFLFSAWFFFTNDPKVAFILAVSGIVYLMPLLYSRSIIKDHEIEYGNLLIFAFFLRCDEMEKDPFMNEFRETASEPSAYSSEKIQRDRNIG